MTGRPDMVHAGMFECIMGVMEDVPSALELFWGW